MGYDRSNRNHPAGRRYLPVRLAKRKGDRVMQDLIKLSQLDTKKIFGLSLCGAQMRARKGRLPGIHAEKHGKNWSYFLWRKKFEKEIGRELTEEDFIERRK